MKNLKTTIFIPLLAALMACTLPLVWAPDPGTPPIPDPPLDVGPALTLTGEPTPTVVPLGTPNSQPTALIDTPPAPSPEPTFAPTAKATPEPPAFILQPGSPVEVPNFSHPEFGCDWLGVGGQVFSFLGKPVKGIIVELGGELAGVETRLLSVTGGTTIYGEGGYEFTLAQQPLESSNTLWIQLFDIAGNPRSDQVLLNTYEDCSRNLILVNFVGVASVGIHTYIPLIIRN